MNIVISGYGRMGHEVEKIAHQRMHEVIAITDNMTDWMEKEDIIKTADVVIDFSLPESALDVFRTCFEWGIPIATGTTGWYKNINMVREKCEDKDACFFYSHNFSMGVNIFFKANRLIAKLTAAMGNYKPSIGETHHIHKLDAPSGTAIKAAEGIIDEYDNITKWKNSGDINAGQLAIISKREGEVIGEHIVNYSSEVDEINISHRAKNRSGFALAVIAAEFIKGKTGFFTMDSLFEELMRPVR
ncbi:MAG: 4-hydroxy-tetrahydrodipicolinate reductase [Chlorobi bacterium]|nr:4-hydroxy-tetrahydrodipicolinate reductase [Chlorobiota bacterium]